MNRRRVFTVSDLTKQIKSILEFSLSILWVEGEISDFTWHPSGHMYFSLKDKHALLRCVMWKTYNQQLFFRPGEGMKVQVQGKITLYERGGQYQLTVYQMHPVGEGEMRLAFEQLAAKLRAEGLFEQDRKKDLPPFPTRIGVVTSPAGAALEDIKRIISQRFPPAQIHLKSVPVQGMGAAERIAAALRELNDEGRVDVIIVGRGGGSPEDLWTFNEEVLVRAIFASRIPVVSAVGHEMDITLSDLVADQRAATPSAAAEMVVPHWREVLSLVQAFQERMSRAMQLLLADRRGHVSRLEESHGMRRCTDLVAQRRQQLDGMALNVIKMWDRLVVGWQTRLQSGARQLMALNPASILERGYSVCRRRSDREIITDARHLRPAEGIEVTFARGSIAGEVTRVRARGLIRRRRGRQDG